jgi:hypothetical protein
VIRSATRMPPATPVENSGYTLFSDIEAPFLSRVVLLDTRVLSVIMAAGA